MSVLSEAAKRLRNNLPDPFAYRASGQHLADLRLLADAYLAEHPADECEPIDETWLTAVGFVEVPAPSPYPPSFRIKFRDMPETCKEFGDLVIYAPSKEHRDWGFKATVAAGGLWHGPTKTRGDVARLCAALGIPLTTKG